MIPQWPLLFLTRFGVRHVAWSVTYVTVPRVPTVSGAFYFSDSWELNAYQSDRSRIGSSKITRKFANCQHSLPLGHIISKRHGLQDHRQYYIHNVSVLLIPNHKFLGNNYILFPFKRIFVWIIRVTVCLVHTCICKWTCMYIYIVYIYMYIYRCATCAYIYVYIN